jgi:triosephosphate isomerase
MNCGPYDAAELLEGLKEKKSEIDENVDVLVCPPFVSIGMAVKYLYDTDILAESGCNYVIIGHSERRQYFGETDATVNKRVHKAIEHKLAPIVCVGESLDQRKSDEHFGLVKNQITAALHEVSEKDVMDAVIAYEPIWAIGTGETASPEQAQEMHEHIRSVLAELYDEDTAEQINILYGGSMKPGNANELLSLKDVDGGLIGGASLDADSFSEIITIAEDLA